MEPLGLKNPILAAKPLGQSLLTPQFIMPVAIQRMATVTPEVFFPKGLPGYEPPTNSFAESPFFAESRSALTRQPVNLISRAVEPSLSLSPQVRMWEDGLEGLTRTTPASEPVIQAQRDREVIESPELASSLGESLEGVEPETREVSHIPTIQPRREAGDTLPPLVEPSVSQTPGVQAKRETLPSNANLPETLPSHSNLISSPPVPGESSSQPTLQAQSETGEEVGFETFPEAETQPVISAIGEDLNSVSEPPLPSVTPRFNHPESSSPPSSPVTVQTRLGESASPGGETGSEESTVTSSVANSVTEVNSEVTSHSSETPIITPATSPTVSLFPDNTVSNPVIQPSESSGVAFNSPETISESAVSVEPENLSASRSPEMALPSVPVNSEMAVSATESTSRIQRLAESETVGELPKGEERVAETRIAESEEAIAPSPPASPSIPSIQRFSTSDIDSSSPFSPLPNSGETPVSPASDSEETPSEDTATTPESSSIPPSTVIQPQLETTPNSGLPPATVEPEPSVNFSPPSQSEVSNNISDGDSLTASLDNISSEVNPVSTSTHPLLSPLIQAAPEPQIETTEEPENLASEPGTVLSEISNFTPTSPSIAAKTDSPVSDAVTVPSEVSVTPVSLPQVSPQSESAVSVPSEADNAALEVSHSFPQISRQTDEVTLETPLSANTSPQIPSTSDEVTSPLSLPASILPQISRQTDEAALETPSQVSRQTNEVTSLPSLPASIPPEIPSTSNEVTSPLSLPASIPPEIPSTSNEVTSLPSLPASIPPQISRQTDEVTLETPLSAETSPEIPSTSNEVTSPLFLPASIPPQISRQTDEVTLETPLSANTSPEIPSTSNEVTSPLFLPASIPPQISRQTDEVALETPLSAETSPEIPSTSDEVISPPSLPASIPPQISRQADEVTPLPFPISRQTDELTSPPSISADSLPQISRQTDEVTPQPSLPGETSPQISRETNEVTSETPLPDNSPPQISLKTEETLSPASDFSATSAIEPSVNLSTASSEPKQPLSVPVSETAQPTTLQRFAETETLTPPSDLPQSEPIQTSSQAFVSYDTEINPILPIPDAPVASELTTQAPSVQRESAAIESIEENVGVPQIPQVLQRLTSSSPIATHQPLVPASPLISPQKTVNSVVPLATPIQRQVETDSEIKVPPVPETASRYPQREPQINVTSDPEIRRKGDRPSVPDSWSDISELLKGSTPPNTEIPTVQPLEEPTDFSTWFPSPQSSEPPLIQRQPETLTPPSEIPSNQQPLAEVITETPENQQNSARQEDTDQLETLAREVYHLLRQRIEVERERRGTHYSGRLPW